MTTIGVLGQHWRATVTPGGSVLQWDDRPALTWFVAADDRWHRPEVEPSVRQRRIEGTPVVETRVKIPTGDAVQRVFAVADGGGMTIVQVENDSTLPIAVAFDGAPVLSARPRTDAPIAGIELSADAAMFPIGHHATLTVAIAHDGGVRPLPSVLPSSDSVVRAWSSLADRSSRCGGPDAAQDEAVTAARCELLLTGLASPADDPVGFLLAADEIRRMTGDGADWVPEVADAVHRTLRLPDAWDVRAALDAATRVLAAAGETRAVTDLAKHRRKAPTPPPALPPTMPTDLADPRLIAWTERRIVGGHSLFPDGIPAAWLGQNVELHRVPVGAGSTVSFALRWHGERPAVLWELAGEPVVLDAPVAAPGWSTVAASGEALWPAPVDVPLEVLVDAMVAVEPAIGRPTVEPSSPAIAPPAPSVGDEPISFS